MLLTVFSAAFLARAAGNAPIDRATLRGLTAVNIIVDKLDDQLQAAGVTSGSIRSRIEDKLRAANITVDSSKSEFVAVRITGVRANRGPFAAAVTLGAYQSVQLMRDAKVRTATQTWEVESVVLAEPKQLYRAAMETIDELSEAFITAYRSVNK